MSERVAKYRRRGTRYKARRRAVDFLFEAEARDVDPVAIVEDRVALSQDQANQVAPVKDYTRQIVAGVAEELDGVDLAIERHLAEDWALERLPAVDRAILRVAVWELLFNEDVPLATAVSQGVELASEYSTDSAGPYINALLDDVARNREELLAAAQAAEAEGVDEQVEEEREEPARRGVEAGGSHSPGAGQETSEQSAPADRETTGPFGEKRADTGIEAVGVEGVEPHRASVAWPAAGQVHGVHGA